MTTTSNNVKNIYSPDALEIIIDDCRSRGDWDILLQSIERYAHIFDAGVAGFTKQHTDLTKVRAYYWICMAQYIYSQKKDFVNAVDCIRRALAIEATYIDIKILASFILLKSTISILSNHKELNEKEVGVDLGTFSFDLPTVLGDLYFKDFVPSDQSKMSDILLSKGSHYKNAFLGIIGCFDNVEVSSIFKEVLLFISEHATPIDESLRVLVLISSRHLLKAVHLVDILDKHQAQRFTDYRLWLWIDAISTRAVINELLQDLEAAKVDNLHICRHILHNNNKSDIIVVPSNLPSVCTNQCILALSRLPLISRNNNLEEDFYKHLLPFTSPQSPLRNIAPIPLLIGTIVEAALYHLNKAIKFKAPLNFYLSNSNSMNDSNDTEQGDTKEPILSEIEAAYDFFDCTKRILSLHVDSSSVSGDTDIASRLNINIIYPTAFSQLNCFQQSEIDSDPMTFSELSSSSLIATFMGAILQFKTNYKNIEKNSSLEMILSLYEWAVSQEVVTDVNILWNLSLAYDKSGKVEESKILQKQCEEYIANNWSTESSDNLSIDLTKDNCNAKYSKYIKLLRWLGLDFQPFEYFWLPSVKYLDISLSLENYNNELLKDLIKSAKTSIECLYKEKGKKYLEILENNLIPNSIEDMEVMEVINKNRYMEYSGENLSDRYSNYNSSKISTNDIINDLASSSYLKEDQNIDEGLFNILYLYAKINQIYARQPTVSEYDKERYRRVSLRIYYFLKSVDRSNFIYRSLSDDFILQYSLSLGELRDFAEAKNVIRNKLQEVNSDISDLTQSKLIHLLCLILSVNLDEPNVNSTAVALCRKAIQINKYDLHLKLTRSYLEFNAGDNESCLSILDQIVSEVTAEYELLKSEEKLTSAQEKKSSSYVTPLKKKNSMIFKDESPSTPDINDQISSVKKTLVTRNKKYITTNSRSTDAFKTILNNKRSLTTLLIGISRLYKNCGKLSKAKSCLENAWMYLFLLSHDVVEEMKSLAKGECSKHRAIDILTQVPTLLGWRLPDACGWAAPHFVDCEADILAEYASVVQKEEGKLVSLRAIELYQLAVTIHPEHVRSLVSLSHIEFQKYKTINNLSDKDKNITKSFIEEESDEKKINEKPIYALVGKDFRDEENDKHLHSALYYSQLALSLRDLNSDSWFVHGLILQHMDKIESSMDSYLTSEECRQYCPIRPFATVLMN